MHAQHFNITNRPALLSNTRDDPIYKTAFIRARWTGGYFDNDHVERWGEESTHGFKDTGPKSLIGRLLVALDRLKPQHSPSCGQYQHDDGPRLSARRDNICR